MRHFDNITKRHANYLVLQPARMNVVYTILDCLAKFGEKSTCKLVDITNVNWIYTISMKCVWCTSTPSFDTMTTSGPTFAWNTFRFQKLFSNSNNLMVRHAFLLSHQKPECRVNSKKEFFALSLSLSLLLSPFLRLCIFLSLSLAFSVPGFLTSTGPMSGIHYSQFDCAKKKYLR